MENSNGNQKKLIINDVHFATYEIEGDLCFLNVPRVINEQTIPAEKLGVLEEDLAAIIGLVEKTEINKIAYLNI